MIKQYNTMQVLKSDVKSVCPVCFKIIKGKTIDEKGTVYLLKSCEEHSDFKEVVEVDPEFYKACLNTKPYSNMIDSIVFSLPVTRKCNLVCNFCYYPIREKPDIALKDVLKMITDYKGLYITITGGEPTLRKDIFQIIKHIRKVNKIPLLCTNGIKLADENYVKELKKSGLDRIQFSLNGLKDNVLIKINGKKLLDLKLKALENIKRYNIPTIASFLIQKDVNEKELKKIYEFSLKNNSFIKEIRIRATSPAGRFKTKDGYYTSELLDMVCQITKIDKKGIISRLNKIKKDKRICSLNIDTLVYQENNNLKTIAWNLKIMRKKYSIEGYLIKIFGKKTMIFNSIYTSFLKPIKLVCTIKPWKEKIQLVSKLLLNKDKFKFIKFSLRCWPNKYNIDLDDNKMCPTITLNYKDELMPFCFSHIYNQSTDLNEGEYHINLKKG